MAKKKKKKLTKKEQQMIKKNIKPIIIGVLILLIIVGVLAFVFRNEIKQYIQDYKESSLPVTKRVTGIEIQSDGLLVWSSVGEHATYTIKSSLFEDVETEETKYDLSNYKTKLTSEATIEIFAKLPNHKLSNKASINIKYDEAEDTYLATHNFVYDGYYDGIEYEMGGQQLFDILHEKINIVTAGNGTQNSSYGEVRYILEDSDINLDNPNFLWGIYDNANIPPSWGDGKVFEREHVWPNSRLGMKRVANTNRNQGSDPHNLRAIIGSTNSRRSNRYFVEGSGVDGYIIGSDQYYPGDAHRGDVARILLYMAVRYDDILSLVETPGGTTYELSGAQMGKLSILLQWHEDDPVDEFEIRRNDIIFDHQGNRNPFIDHPELFEKVYDVITKVALENASKIKVIDIIIINLEIQNNAYLNYYEKLNFQS